MKLYESANKPILPINSYVMVRVDGKAFHTFTRGMQRPFDETMVGSMNAAMLKLCNDMQNVVFAYCQSDEISVLMYDGVSIKAQPFFANEVQKICSISASITTAAFNQAILSYRISKLPDCFVLGDVLAITGKKQAEFDSRCFVLPNKYEVVNYMLWRYQDCVRNSISSLAQSVFSHKQLHKKNNSEQQNMLYTEKGINWNDLDDTLKRGRLCVKSERGWNIIPCPHIICDEQNEIFKLIP